MSSLSRTSGGTFSTTGTPVAFIGKTQKFFAVVVKNVSATAQDLAAEGGPDEAVELVNSLITNGSSTFSYGASIHALQVEDTTGQISYILDSADGGWTAATLQAAIRALGTVNSIDCSGTTVTDVGFKLAIA